MRSISLILLVIFLLMSFSTVRAQTNNPHPWWEVQAIDTMKFSRDPSREFLSNRSLGSKVIKQQVAQIAETGATHVAIATPYDEEFKPLLKEWVAEARSHGLNVWFRGNWSGWEGWFDYGKISREDHIKKTTEFVLNNPALFEDGDIFSACPECENGGAGDPRLNNGKSAHQKFMIDEYKAVLEAFEKIDKAVEPGFHSMNGDVARLVMDRATTKAVGGYIVVDHYVKTPQQLITDVNGYASQSGGKVVLGEWGAPIPDIHGSMTQRQQADWLEEALTGLAKIESVYGLNYWTGVGGSTALWEGNGTPKEAAQVLAKFYKPTVFSGKVTDLDGKPLTEVSVRSQIKTVETDQNGEFVLPYLEKSGNLIFEKDAYVDAVFSFESLADGQSVQLEAEFTPWYISLQRWFKNLLDQII